jgi:LCP family protein required for cell wall assembly
MFEHLDDECPFTPGAEFRAGVVTGGRRRRRVRRLTVAAVSGATAVMVLVAAVAAYGAWQVTHIDRLRVGSGTLSPVASATAPFDVLIAGVDRRVDPQWRRVTLLSVPRDLWTAIPGLGHEDRIGNAFDTGGPDLLARTVEQALGIPVNHIVVLDMAGLPALVDALGGVTVQVDSPLRDAYSGLDLPAPGCQTLNGRDVLALVRSRHLQMFRNGQWQVDPTSDLGRQLRVEVVLQDLGDKARQAGADPLALAQLVQVFVDHVTVDSTLSTGEIFDIARKLLQAGPGAVQSSVLPVQATINGAGAVLVTTTDTGQAVHDFIAGAALPAPPAPVGITGPPTAACRN